MLPRARRDRVDPVDHVFASLKQSSTLKNLSIPAKLAHRERFGYLARAYNSC